MSIYAAAYLFAHAARRDVYLCDSFAGVPAASTGEDRNVYHMDSWLSVSLAEVKENFARFGLLRQNVHFWPGYFQRSLPALRAHFAESSEKIAILFLDADLFESYYDILFNLYEFVPRGGFVLCEDCDTVPEATKAVEQFLDRHGITEQIYRILGAQC